MINKLSEILVDKIIDTIGEEKDRHAYRWIVRYFRRDIVVESLNLACAKHQQGIARDPRRYFMGIMRRKARQNNIPWFKGDSNS